MSHLNPIPSIAVVQAVARNGAHHRNNSEQNMRHAFAVRGEELPENDEPQEGNDLSFKEVRSLFQEVEQKHSQLKFEFHEDINRILVSVIDRATGELIRQIPGEAAITIAKHLNSLEPDERYAGMFLSSEI